MSDSRRVALDARLTRQMSVGMKAYARELAARLPRIAPDLEFIAFTQGSNFSFDEQIRLPLAVRGAHAGLTHFFSQYAPLLAPSPFVITIHDLIHLLFPQNFKTKVGPYYRTVVRSLCARAERIITDDDRTVVDIVRLLRADAARICVIPLGVDNLFLRPLVPHRAAKPFFLYVGNHRKHKDLETLFGAWQSLPLHWKIDLYLTGPDDFGGELQRRAQPGREIVALGDLQIDRLAQFYAGAFALVHPALREGFGLPMLEAMAARCPVIACSDSLPNVLRGAALVFAPKDPQAAAQAMLRLHQDQVLRETLVNEGRTRAERLTWDRCAAATADVYREVLEETRH